MIIVFSGIISRLLVVSLYDHNLDYNPFNYILIIITMIIIPCFAEVGKDQIGNGRGIHARVFNEVARLSGGRCMGLGARPESFAGGRVPLPL